MNELLEFIYVEGDILQTMIHLFIIILSFDFLLSFSNGIKSIKSSAS